MTGKSIGPQLPMTEVNYLPPTEISNQGIELDFIEPIRFKQTFFHVSINIPIQ